MDRSSFRLDDIEKTWIFDLDGTLVVHNGYKNGVDELLSGVKVAITDEDLLFPPEDPGNKPEHIFS